jgi:homopolymeric O-antigen transport system permease protein
MIARALPVLYALTVSDLRARYGRGTARLLKWLLDPFALVGVYLLLVTFVLDRPGRAPGLSVACAVVPFQLLMASIINALNAVNRRKSILLNMEFRRELIPPASVSTESVAFGASLVLLVVTMVGYRVAPTVHVLWLPLALATTVVLALACAYPACLLGVWLPQLRNFVISFVRTIFFLAPGLVALTQIHGTTADVIRANPLTGLFESYRAALLYGHRPAAWQFLIPLGWALVLIAVFGPIYRSEQRHFAKVIE